MIALKELPPDMREQLERERRDARWAAATFARVVASGDADRLFEAAYLVGEAPIEAWRLAMMKVRGSRPPARKYARRLCLCGSRQKCCRCVSAIVERWQMAFAC
jgi:hypothetical protein